MGRAMRWLKEILTTGRNGKDGHTDLKEKHVAIDWHDGVEKERSRWNFVKQRKSAVDGGKKAELSQTPVTAAEPSRVRPCRCRHGEEAGVVIQKAFRGYLARKALHALRSLVKMQALVRGYLVRKRAATTLHRLHVLMRLQSDSCAAKQASYRKSMEQERVVAQQARTKPAHRRRLSDSRDSNHERSPRIVVVEVDTCHLRSRSTRIVGTSSRYAAERSSDPAPPCSPLPSKPPPRLSVRRSHEREPRTAQNMPRCLRPADPTYDSPAKSVGGVTSHRPDVPVSPRYMAGTASSAARMRCQSAPRQRQAEAPRSSFTRAESRKAGAQMQDSFCFHGSEHTRTGCSAISDEAGRDYYLDRMW